MKEAFESINSELFNSFNPNDELWIGGAAHTITTSMGTTFNNDRMDTFLEGIIDVTQTE